MPRVAPLSKRQALDQNAIVLYKHFASERTPQELLKIMGYSRETHYNRQRRPGDFTLDQLRALYQAGHLTDGEILSMIRLEKDKNEPRFN